MNRVYVALRWFPIFSLLFSGVCAADIHKCVGKDGTVSYSDSPCPEVKQAPNANPGNAEIRRFSKRQADIAYDCIELLQDVSSRMKEKASRDPAGVVDRNTLSGFEKYCPDVGFRTPLDKSTLKFNLQHARILQRRLEVGGHSGPSYTRIYTGGQRTPALFEAISESASTIDSGSDEWPFLRKGLWRFEALAKGTSNVSEECQPPVEKLKQIVANLERMDCQRGRVKKTPGGAYLQLRSCKGSGPDNKPVQTDASLKISNTSPDAFVVEMKLGTYSERLEGRRVSDCAPRNARDEIKPAPQISPGAVNSGDVR